nr:hypothetical protein [Tanacetum cinerariifolium]
ISDTVLFLPPAQVYSPPKKDMSWTGLPEFADDTITDYSRPSPSIESNSNDLQDSNSSVSEHGGSSESIMSKPTIKFVKAVNSTGVIKTNKTKTAKKPPVKYAEIADLFETASVSTARRVNTVAPRPNVNSAQPKTTQDLVIIKLIQRVKRLERELKARTPPTKIHYVEVRGRSSDEFPLPDYFPLPVMKIPLLEYFATVSAKEFPLLVYFATASEDRFPLLSERDAPAEEFALLMKSRVNCGQRHINNSQDVCQLSYKGVP